VLVAASTLDAFREEEVFFPGDIIHAVNGTAISSLDALRAAIDRLQPGDALVAHVERGGEMTYVAFQVE
jgi:S1-C subfamily serine protease